MAPKDQKPPRVAPNGNAKPFRCNRCESRGFRTLGAKQRHDRELHLPNKYECEYCKVTFKRRYQLEQHEEAGHTEQQDFETYATTDISSNQGSRESVDSHPSDEAAARFLQRAGDSPFQRPPTAQEPLSVLNRSLNRSEAYNSSNSGYPVGSSYAANASAAFVNCNHLTLASVSENQTPSHAGQSSYLTTNPKASFTPPNIVPWGAPIGQSRPTASAPSSGPAIPNLPSQPTYQISSASPYYLENSRLQNNTSPLLSPSNEQGSPFGQLTRSSYTGEAGQLNYWSQQHPPKPQ